ncbi:MAG: hypothetical protein ACOVQR_02995 [Flavobacterium sp.]|jgi:hypothetical protein|uniref:hypothetical protein n=1 Tax=Flavobacterium sp. TaxID=239 RepID=UPI003BA3F505
MVAENIFIIAEQLSYEEQVQLYKMLGEKLKPKPTKRPSKSKFDITDEESIALLKKMYFSRKVRGY